MIPVDGVLAYSIQGSSMNTAESKTLESSTWITILYCTVLLRLAMSGSTGARMFSDGC